MDILFDRQTRTDRIAEDRSPVDGVDVARKPYFDSVAERLEIEGADDSSFDESGACGDALSPEEIADQLSELNDEVDHLRACIDQLLDLLEVQSRVVDDVDLLFDRVGLSDRRIQRVEDAVSDRYDGPLRRAEDEA